MRSVILLLVVICAPVSACINDSRTPLDEAEYKARYTSLAAPSGGLTWRGVVLGGMGVISLSILGLGIGFWWRERQAALLRPVSAR